MIDQLATIDGPTGRASFGLDAVAAAWRFRIALALICVGAGLLSVMLGPDNYWDLRYYHLYAPWAYLHDRYLYHRFDFGHAGFGGGKPVKTGLDDSRDFGLIDAVGAGLRSQDFAGFVGAFDEGALRHAVLQVRPHMFSAAVRDTFIVRG
jgi:hypothetical protein